MQYFSFFFPCALYGFITFLLVIGITHCSCCRLRVKCSSRDIHFCIPSEDESVAAGGKRELLPHDFTRPFLGLHFFLSFSIITGDNPFCARGANSQFGDFPLRENKEGGGLEEEVLVVGVW